MLQFFQKYKKRIGYALYGILLAFVLLFFLFPSDVIRDYIKASVHSKNPSLNIYFQKASLSFPIAMKFTGVECRDQGVNEETVFKAKDIIVTPKLLSLIGKSPEFVFTCHAYDGTITGRIDLQKKTKEDIYRSTAEFKNIHIDAGSALPAFVKDGVDGILEGAVSYSGSGLFDLNGNGEASVRFSKGSLKFTKPIFLNINVIEFNELSIKAALKDQNINLSDINLKGDSILCQATGAIKLGNSIMKSRLNIKGTIEPAQSSAQNSKKADKQLSQKGRFILQGAFEDLEFRFY